MLQKKWARLLARENLPHVFAAVFEAEAHLDYLLLVLGQRAQPLSGLVFQRLLRHARTWTPDSHPILAVPELPA